MLLPTCPAVPRQMRITFSSLDSIPCPRQEIGLEYHKTRPRRCLLYATFKNESDLDLENQDHTKNVIFKIKIRTLKYFDLEDQDEIAILVFKIRSCPCLSITMYSLQNIKLILINSKDLPLRQASNKAI